MTNEQIDILALEHACSYWRDLCRKVQKELAAVKLENKCLVAWAMKMDEENDELRAKL